MSCAMFVGMIMQVSEHYFVWLLCDGPSQFEYRKEVLEQFIRLTNCDLKVDVSMLADVAGPAGIDGSLELLVATPEVASGVQIINRIRKDNVN